MRSTCCLMNVCGEHKPMLNEPRSFQPDTTPPIDEHDEPTEPMYRADVDAFVPTLPNNVAFSDEEGVPSPKSLTQPFPHQYAQSPPIASNGPQYAPPLVSTYPYLPAKPGVPHENRPAGGALPVQPEVVNTHSQGQRVRRNGVPLMIGMCFVAIQLLLLVRFLLKLLNISSDIGWVGAVYGVSNVFVLPFRVLFLQLAIPLLVTAELYTLLAILVYSIASRIIVHTLKALLKTR